jgi:uncharacterized membrane protein
MTDAPHLGGPPTAHIAEHLDARAMSTAAYALFLVTLFTGGLSAIAAVIIVYLVRKDADRRLQSHVRFQIRTFWIGFAAAVAGVLLIPAGGFGLIVLLCAGLWFMVRAAAGLNLLLRGKPYPNPRALVL